MKRIPAVLAALLILLSSSFPGAAAAETVDLTVLHINDFHGNLLPKPGKEGRPATGGISRIAKMVAEEREQNPDGTLLLSAGDMFQGTPISNLFRGRPVIEAMNRMGLDAMTVGNHEFDWGMEAFHDLRQAAAFPFLSANIVDGQGALLPGVKPYILVPRKGLKIAVIGITTPETHYATKPGNLQGYRVIAVEKVLPALIGKVRQEGAGTVIVLSHLGLDEDREMASKVGGIDLIVGGHSHTEVKTPVVVGSTIIVQAGYYGQHLGVLKISVDKASGKIVRHPARGILRKVRSGPADPVDEKVESIVRRYDSQIREEFGRIVGETRVDLAKRPFESNLGNLVTDAMREATGADAAIQNNGGIRTTVPRGKITLEQVYMLLPFDNNLMTLELTGSQVAEILEHNAKTEGMLQVSGLRVVYDMAAPEGSRVKELFIDGKPAEHSKTYRVTTNDFLAAGGDRFGMFREGKNAVVGDNVRDAFLDYLKRHSPVSPRTEGRIVVTP
ncbi:MAG: bifunctional metallophosphatase/5'-nucleotidase [Syntrophaceae bacterium]|nr:bifunctional metallophosphatase/5'-nucleotidase [Syntrophaceae bacterium]